jgi:hypothetical protein
MRAAEILRSTEDIATGMVADRERGPGSICIFARLEESWPGIIEAAGVPPRRDTA